MSFRVNEAQNHNFCSITLRCPTCRQIGTFVKVNGDARDTIFNRQDGRVEVAGLRMCPNGDCRALAFVAYEPGKNQVGNVLSSFPPERVDFDASGIPAPVVQAFEEAITCHANNAPTAAAIMIRKTLEELCADQKASGPNLFKRLEELGNKIIVPTALLGAAQELRLLGNDAAHIEAQAFNQVSEAEVEAGLDLAKELLKAVYQMEGLVDRLKKLKRAQV